MISQVNRDEMRQRLLARAKSSGRVDDEEAVIEKRLNTCLGRSRGIGFTGCPWMAIPDYGNLCLENYSMSSLNLWLTLCRLQI